jgi:hypothetical protein
MTVRMISCVLALALLFVVLQADAVCAHYDKSRYTVTLENTWGDSLPHYYHKGKVYVLGIYGDRYNIRVRNHTNRRVEAVVSVDGRDAVSGKVGDYVKQRGYIIKPYDSVLIEGFRQSLSEVAAFRFTEPANSYSSRMGTPQNVGVIGVAIFPEKKFRPRPRPPRPLAVPESSSEHKRRTSESSSRSRAPAGSAEAEDRAAARAPKHRRKGAAYGSKSERMDEGEESMGLNRNNLGTEYGESRYSRVREVQFRRANPRCPSRLIALYYDDSEGLISRGIKLYPEPYAHRFVESVPRAFPRNRFAPPPP